MYTIVIIAKNEAHIIGATLKAIQGLTDDVILYVNDSTDNTVAIATSLGAKVINGKWQGYGATKNEAHTFAKYNWILSLDADEVVDDVLYQALKNVQPTNAQTVYAFARKTIWQQKQLNYGGSKEIKTRLFNKTTTCWNLKPVHEALEYKQPPNVILIPGTLQHYSYTSVQHAYKVMDKYAALGKNRNWPIIIAHVKGLIDFCKFYFLKLGILDGKAGLQWALLKRYYGIQKVVKDK